MVFSILADIVVLIHAVFILFAVLGGFLVWRWKKATLVHLPAVAWAVTVELAGWTCPLTPLENYLRRSAGQSVYEVDFVNQYILPLVYPAGLTRQMQILMGVFVVVVNLIVYWRGYCRRRGLAKSKWETGE